MLMRCLPPFVGLLLFCAASFAQPAKQIIWYGIHQPPASFVYGEHKKQGYLDQLLTLLQQALPQYKHLSMVATLGRVEADMKAGKSVCFPAMTNTAERQAFALFSRHFMMQPGLRVIVSEALASRLKLLSPINLNQLFSEHQLVLGTVAERNYGKEINDVLAKHKGQILSRVDHSNIGLFEMFSRNRFDMLLAYPDEANYAFKHTAADFPYRSLNIEGITPFSAGSIGCSKTPWGEQTIEDINKAIDQIRTTDAFFDAMHSWLPEKNLSPEYRAFFERHFLHL